MGPCLSHAMPKTWWGSDTPLPQQPLGYRHLYLYLTLPSQIGNTARRQQNLWNGVHPAKTDPPAHLHSLIIVFAWCSMNLLLLCQSFTALRHFSGHFGRGELTYPHCSWASLLGSLPVLSAHSFTSNWQLPFLNQRKRDKTCHRTGQLAWDALFLSEVF